jgi:N-terminal region of glycosyl transferase group 7
MTEPIPKIIFIIPYRDRENQKGLFIRQMSYVVEDLDPSDYKIYFSEQCDQRDFNRGAMKNIGFLAMKAKYPNDYKNISFVFNDVDTMPYNKNVFNYATTQNNIKHFYGYLYALGGIISILGSDFEKMQGFPNLWCWGFEDNMLQFRAQKNKINIDRTNFFPILSKEVIQLVDDVYKKTNKSEFDRYINDKPDNIFTITDLQYEIDEENQTIRVKYFNIPYKNNPSKNEEYDIRSGAKPFDYVPTIRRYKSSMKMNF